MILKQLLIMREDYGINKGMLVGNIEYAGEYGKIEVRVNSSQCQKILEVVADAIVATSKDLANNLTAEIVSASGPLLEHRPEQPPSWPDEPQF